MLALAWARWERVCDSDVLLAAASIAQTNTSALAASIGGEQARLLGSLRVVGGGTFELRGRALPPVVEQVQMIGWSTIRGHAGFPKALREISGSAES